MSPETLHTITAHDLAEDDAREKYALQRTELADLADRMLEEKVTNTSMYNFKSFVWNRVGSTDPDRRLNGEIPPIHEDPDNSHKFKQILSGVTTNGRLVEVRQSKEDDRNFFISLGNVDSPDSEKWEVGELERTYNDDGSITTILPVAHSGVLNTYRMLLGDRAEEEIAKLFDATTVRVEQDRSGRVDIFINGQEVLPIEYLIHELHRAGDRKSVINKITNTAIRDSDFSSYWAA